jgi:hypothetical protein
MLDTTEAAHLRETFTDGAGEGFCHSGRFLVRIQVRLPAYARYRS